MINAFVKIHEKDSRDAAKAKILEKMTNQWLEDNPGLAEDIEELATKLAVFNTKWGTNLDIKDML